MKFTAMCVLAFAAAAEAFTVPSVLPTASSRVNVNGALTGLNMMRHKCKGDKLSLPADQRKALLRSLTTELIRHGRITTTITRAKAMRTPVREPPVSRPPRDTRVHQHPFAPLPAPPPRHV
jgi:hypothetical protein